ncbi:AAA family ATPase [Hydrogenimonas thermophila]|uniref:AAA family ATPase n=1 Tax=Hydrogenimonas thermophila TaxID=223786 RepID=UPI002936F0F8|nr:AAA family ATPase [Hydrogenimonas thermophila]WOE69039.1 AAA family ATPase [Hydrogenimonas thermophila]WOE71549.1 AAA family ATPase [Hydrogenimonas thermophila]
MKRIPYGLTDFVRIRTEDWYFVDKTKYIEILENYPDNYVMFLRPRRFGKTLFLAILDAYYNVQFKDDFDLLFKDTYIHSHKTKEANSYYVLRFDFSVVDTLDVEKSFLFEIELKTKSFVKRYNLNISTSKEPLLILRAILDYFIEHQTKNLYILIDEYDHFANRLLLQDRREYLDVVSQKEAVFKQFFTVLKAGTSGNNAPIKRMFITGVTPMTMYDVTSGFNIGSNISLNSSFNEMLGFSENEVKEMMEYFHIPLKYFDLMKEWYDNYQFSKKNSTKIFNTDMASYFIKEYHKEDEPPRELIDINVRSDYSKLRDVIYTNRKLNGNFETLKNLIAGDTIELETIKTDFSGANFKDEDNFKSLLFYLGLVTIKEVALKTVLKIPNETIKRIDIDFLKDSLELEEMFELNVSKLSALLADFARYGKLEVFNYLAQEIKRNTGLRDYIQNEQTIKAMFLAYLSLTQYFVVKSELELNKGFADITLKPLNPYVEYFGLLEFKFYHKKDEKPNTIKTLVSEAKEQLNRYEKDELVQNFIKEGKRLVKVVLVFRDYELVEVQ